MLLSKKIKLDISDRDAATLEFIQAKCRALKKRNKHRDSLHKASHLISHTLVERTVVVGDLSQRQMVTKQHQEHLARLGPHTGDPVRCADVFTAIDTF